ncbi:hypothetical protein COY87_04350 [Candidatus Roizmanbacteria bacterium CG_4_10_14_0_8_um_filter_33_9]|uniref:UDP-N-acetylglucosamine 1-carboxyvinyltransferase n=1 Tax=Candidatus Roizmanbacteria bacterium CG_4_10_14_0_8_um_filter_33_9 TaxID=1974826 RepID=A0A2M7QIG9_9BACT|nr:MAG: hypothetical protein COY87_04350 [Candidatus Roizmanbacteria bacterium CG_4_10_14_0_8_um_filter_33_9]
MEDSLLIKGGKPLKGDVFLSGAKNVALKVTIAALLFRGKVVLRNIPRINDIFEIFSLIHSLGGEAEFVGTNEVEIDSKNLSINKLDFLYASKIRTSFMFFAPLLYRFHKAYIPNPGGCRLGARSIDRIVEGLKALGIQVNYESSTGYYSALMSHKPTGTYTFIKPSHTGTELLIMMSVFCKDSVVIQNCALEPEIDDLILFLNISGAKIKKKGSTITIWGVEKLIQKNPFSIVSDRNEAVTYAIAGIVTRGDITIHSIPENYISCFVNQLKEVGAGVEYIKDDSWRFFYKSALRPSHIITNPHPGFMTDWQPNWAVLMTQANGVSIIHERVFENRFSYVNELVKVGAKIDFFQPKVKTPSSYYHFTYDKTKTYKQAIKIYGPQTLHNGVLTIADLRAGATLALTGLITSGETIINNVSILERGYENFVSKIVSLGGNIKKI